MDLPNNYKNIQSYDVRHLPIIKAFCDKLNIANITDSALDTKMEYSPGKVVVGLVQDTLAGRNPLCRVSDFFSHQDIELVVGKGIKLAAFSDDNIGRVLDRIFSYGTQKLFSSISMEAVDKFSIDTSKVHHDTTSVNVWGDYLNQNDESINLAYGYSKDHRPDLKQFIFSLLCVEKDIPIHQKMYDGNTDDKTISKNILKRISKYMNQYGVDTGGFVLIADAAAVFGDNLKVMGGISNQKVKFISRMPATFNATGSLVGEAVEKNLWDDIGILPNKTKDSAYYKSYDTKVTIDDSTYRATVIHSDFYDRRKLKKIDRELARDKDKALKLKKKLEKLKFYCRKDAEAHIDKEKLLKYHRLNLNVAEKKIYKRGRPKDGIKKVKNLIYVLNVDIAACNKLISDLKEQAGCFVLLSNVSTSEYTARDILKIYKEQYGIEKNFGFLKDPLIVNDLFLKKPERIEALGLILVLSLLIWRLAKRSMRRFIDKKDITITGWDKKQTKNPTSFMMSTKFCSVHVLKSGSMRWLSRKITNVQIEYLNALGLDKEIFYKVLK